MIAALLQQQITQLSEQYRQSPHPSPHHCGGEWKRQAIHSTYPLSQQVVRLLGAAKGQNRPSSLSEAWSSLVRERGTNQNTPSDRVCLLTRWQRWINSTVGRLRCCRYHGSLNVTMYVLTLRRSWTVGKVRRTVLAKWKILTRPRVNAIVRFTVYLRQCKLLLFSLHNWNLLVPLKS